MPAETNLNTYFTKPGETKQMFAMDGTWRRISLLLETAGPVVVGQQENLRPIAAGKGRFLPVGKEITVFMPPLSRLYISSDAVNRVGYTIQALAYEEYLQGILKTLGAPAPASPGAPGSGVNIGGFGFKGTLPGKKG